jgi:hypothetical protein
MSLNWKFSASLMLVAALTGCGGGGMSPDPAPNVSVALAVRGEGGGGAAASTETVASTGTGWATIKGVFKIQGGVPAASFFDTGGKDVAACGTKVLNDSILVDPSSKGIHNILVYSRKKVSRIYDAYKSAPSKPVEFDQEKCMFHGHVYALQLKDSMLIKNSDPVGHNVKMSPLGNPEFNQNVPPKESTTYKFEKQLPAPTEATCSIHPWMKAYIMCREDPYFAITKTDGSFEIANVPAGEELEFQVWHEKAPSGLAAKPDWAQGRFKLKLNADETKDLGTIEVPQSAFQ